MRVLFTGFTKSEKVELIAIAVASGHTTHKTVIKSLDILVFGTTAGSAKMTRAKSQSQTQIMDAETFIQLFCQRGIKVNYTTDTLNHYVPMQQSGA